MAMQLRVIGQDVIQYCNLHIWAYNGTKDRVLQEIHYRNTTGQEMPVDADFEAWLDSIYSFKAVKK
jgi:hypothetical protein